MNFSSLINQIAKRLPDKVALIENGTLVTYSELWDKVEAITNSLFEIGLKKDDKVALILPNCKEFIFFFFGILRANIVTVPINPNLSCRELRNIFDDSKPNAVISNSSTLNKILSKDALLLNGKIIINCDTQQSESLNEVVESIMTLDRIYKPKGYLPLHKFTTKNEQIASINYTYRGYGYPLGAVLTHGNYIHGAVGYIRLVKPDLNQRFLLIMPASHIFTLIGCVVVPLLRGSTVVILRNVIPTHIFKAIQDYKIDFLVGVPTLYKVLSKIYDSSKHDISSLKYGISGGASIDQELYHDIKNKMGFQLLQGYGLTETLPVVCNPKTKIKSESLGVPGHEVKVKIVDESGNVKMAGEKGEILIGGPTVMKGYYNRINETQQIVKNGWVHTGDIGRLDEDGYLYFEGVKKDIVKIGGNTVDLREIKNILSSHPDVINAKIYTKQNDLWGSVVEAEVCIKRNSSLSEIELKRYCNENLAIYKVPRKIKIIKARVKDENRAYIPTRCAD